MFIKWNGSDVGGVKSIRPGRAGNLQPGSLLKARAIVLRNTVALVIWTGWTRCGTHRRAHIDAWRSAEKRVRRVSSRPAKGRGWSGLNPQSAGDPTGADHTVPGRDSRGVRPSVSTRSVLFPARLSAIRFTQIHIPWFECSPNFLPAGSQDQKTSRPDIRGGLREFKGHTRRTGWHRRRRI